VADGIDDAAPMSPAIPVRSHSNKSGGVFLIGFAALPIRGALYTLTDNPYFLVGVQSMEGIGAAIFGVVSVLVIADLTSGTGRFNFTQGVVATATRLGASL
jgi:hypothetical protein